MYLVINKWVIAVKVSNVSGQYLRNRSTLDVGVLGYIGIVWPKEHLLEVWSVPPVTLCILSFSARTYSHSLERRIWWFRTHQKHLCYWEFSKSERFFCTVFLEHKQIFLSLTLFALVYFLEMQRVYLLSICVLQLAGLVDELWPESVKNKHLSCH